MYGLVFGERKEKSYNVKGFWSFEKGKVGKTLTFHPSF